MTFKLNYTRIESGLVDTEDIKTFMVVVRRKCLKTGTCAHYLQFVIGKKMT